MKEPYDLEAENASISITYKCLLWSFGQRQKNWETQVWLQGNTPMKMLLSLTHIAMKEPYDVESENASISIAYTGRLRIYC